MQKEKVEILKYKNCQFDVKSWIATEKSPKQQHVCMMQIHYESPPLEQGAIWQDKFLIATNKKFKIKGLEISVIVDR